MELRQVKLQADQLKTHSGKDLTYDEYCSLLLSVAQQYDCHHSSSRQKVAKRRIYEHDYYSQNDTDYPEKEYEGSYDIDLSIADLEIYSTKFQKGPRITYAQWKAIPEDATKIWDMLSPEAQSIILCPFSKSESLNSRHFDQQKPPFRQQGALPPHHTINTHELDYLTSCLYDLHGADPPSETSETPLKSQPVGDTSVHEDITEPDT